jgi:hypothetical protein
VPVARGGVAPRDCKRSGSASEARPNFAQIVPRAQTMCHVALAPRLFFVLVALTLSCVTAQCGTQSTCSSTTYTCSWYEPMTPLFQGPEKSCGTGGCGGGDRCDACGACGMDICATRNELKNTKKGGVIEGCGLAFTCDDLVEFKATYSPPATCKEDALLSALRDGRVDSLVRESNFCLRPELTTKLIGGSIEIKANGCPDHAYFKVGLCCT